MSSSEFDEDLSSCGMSGPAMGTRKRSKGASLILSDSQGEQEDVEMEFGDDEIDTDSDEDFVVDKKKGRLSVDKNKKSLNNSNTSLKSNSKISVPASLTTSSPISSRPMVILKSTEVVKLEVKFVKGEDTATAIESDYNCNIDVERPITIATPKEINSRSSDQEEFLTPSSTPMEEVVSCDKIVQRMASEVAKTLQSISPSSHSNPPLEGQVTTPVSSISLSQPVLSHPPTTATGPALGPDTGVRLAQSRPVPVITRPPLRPAPRMLRPPRPGLHRKPAGPIVGGPYRHAGPRPRSGGPRMPIIRSITPLKRRSLSTPQYSSQFLPPVVELDASPPHSGKASPLPPTCSALSKLSSLAVSVAREKVSTTKHGWVLPPGISVTKTTSSREEGPSLSLPSLAKALIQLGDVEGRKRVVQFNLTDEQVRALNVLGVREGGI